MTRRRWTAVVSTVTFIGLAVAIGLVPIPFVRQFPGAAIDLLGAEDGESVVDVKEATTYATTGKLFLPLVAQSKQNSSVTLPQALLSLVMSDQAVIPREAVYPARLLPEQQEDNDQKLMLTTQRDATTAALIQAGLAVNAFPQVTQVSGAGPAYGKVEVGDYITAINGSVVAKRSEIPAILSHEQPGSVVRLNLIRKDEPIVVLITAVASPGDSSAAQIGLKAVDSYHYSVSVDFKLDAPTEGTDGGLPLAIAIYDKITPGTLIADRAVAATGSITAGGAVGASAGIRQKLRSAEQAGAEVMLVPDVSCPEVENLGTSMTLVKVKDLNEAITSLELLKDPGTAVQVPTC